MSPLSVLVMIAMMPLAQDRRIRWTTPRIHHPIRHKFSFTPVATGRKTLSGVEPSSSAISYMDARALCEPLCDCHLLQSPCYGRVGDRYYTSSRRLVITFISILFNILPCLFIVCLTFPHLWRNSVGPVQRIQLIQGLDLVHSLSSNAQVLCALDNRSSLDHHLLHR